MQNKEETKSDLMGRFYEFQAEVKKLERKPEGLEQELSAKRGKLERLRAARASQLAMDETEKAKILAAEIKKLEAAIEPLEAKVAAFGPGGRRSVQTLVANAQDSELFNLALSIVNEAAETAPALENEIHKFLSFDLDLAKQEYLKTVDDFSDKVTRLWEICRAGLTAQKYLPEEL